MSLYRLFIFEIKKLFKQRIAHAGIIILAIVCILYCLIKYMTRPLDSYSGISIITDTITFQNSILILPLVAILMAAHSISEEVSTGTLRTLMTRPLKRENIVVSKFLAVLVYLCCATYLTMVISFGFGFRWGFPEDFVSLIPLLLFTYLMYILANMVLVAFALLVSSFGMKSTMTALTTAGFHIVLLILGYIPQVQKFTFFYHVNNVIYSIIGMTATGGMMYQSLVVILVYILGILLIATITWEKRDITA